MSVKRQFDFAAFLADHPVFSLLELTAARGERSKRACHFWLKYHVQTGRVQRVARELYAAVPPGLDAARFQPDRYLVAAAARPDGTFAYHAALELLGAGHSVWGECTLLTSRPRSPLRLLAGIQVVFLAIPGPLRRCPDLGVELVTHVSRRLRVTGPERTLVEGFRNPRRVGGLAELVDSVRGFPLIDFGLLEELLRAYGQRNLWAAVGWLTESERETWSTPARFLEACHLHQPRRPQYLVRDARAGRMLSSWNLILPSEVDLGFEGHAADV